VAEWLAEPRLIVPKLGLGDREVLADAVAFEAVGTGQAFHRVQDRTRSVVFAGEHGLTSRGAFQVALGRPSRMKDQAKAQTTINAKRKAARFADVALVNREKGGNLGNLFFFISSQKVAFVIDEQGGKATFEEKSRGQSRGKP